MSAARTLVPASWEAVSHTPGNWEVAPVIRDGGPIEWNVMAGNIYIAMAFGQSDPRVTRANALLIAAGPALLAVAQAVLDYAAADEDSLPAGQDDDTVSIRLGDLRKLCDAVAKAEGDAP